MTKILEDMVKKLHLTGKRFKHQAINEQLNVKIF